MNCQKLKLFMICVILMVLLGCNTNTAINKDKTSLESSQRFQNKTQISANPQNPNHVSDSLSATEPKKEYLFVTTTAYSNGYNDDEGINLVIYCFDIIEEKMNVILDVPINSTYPANCIDVQNGVIYYAAANEGEYYDNLFAYDIETGRKEQLTYGKYLFSDLLFIDNKVFANTAREYATVTQPAVFDMETNSFHYLNEDDDDTWHHSFSHNYSNEKFLILSCSNKEMRTHKVTAETHIRPKTISYVDKNLVNIEPLYYTDTFEIRLTRQLDENHILMTVDPFMGSSLPRTMKLLDIDTQTISDFIVPDIDEVFCFYPRNNGEGVFLIGKDFDLDNTWQLYYFDLIENTVERVLGESELPDDFRAFIDIVYSIQ